MENNYINEVLLKQIAKDQNVRISQIHAVLGLIEQGATVPFIARYRKEITGNLDEEQIRAIYTEWDYGQKLAQRKEDVMRLIEEKGKLTEEIRNQIINATKLNVLEDIYRPYKEKKKTRATEAKKKGLPVSGEVTVHHLLLCEDDITENHGRFKMNPPLRRAEDVEAIIAGLADGTIDAIATDHAPHHIDEKNVEFAVAANGIIGLETALALGITYLVKKNRLTLPELLRKMTQNPAHILGISRGRLSEGQAADLVIFDAEKPFVFKKEDIASKSKNSPYIGQELYGKVEYTIVGGKIVVENGELV